MLTPASDEELPIRQEALQAEGAEVLERLVIPTDPSVLVSLDQGTTGPPTRPVDMSSSCSSLSTVGAVLVEVIGEARNGTSTGDGSAPEDTHPCDL